METVRVTINIAHEATYMLNECSENVSNNLEDLLKALRGVQQKTNDCLTKMTNEAKNVCAKDKSDTSEGDSDDEDDAESAASADPPKRAKFKN